MPHQYGECVYIIQCESCPHYKIGITSRLPCRLHALSGACPYTLHVIGQFMMPSKTKSLEVEKKLHRRYQDCNMRGEWFHLDDEQLEEIKFFFANNCRFPSPSFAL
jgi:hypothetical protein